MGPVLSLAVSGIAIVCGLLLLCHGVIQIRLYRHHAVGLAPRTKGRWRWQILRSISAAFTLLAFGLFGITRPSDIFAWILVLGVIAAGALVVSQIRLSEFDAQS